MDRHITKALRLIDETTHGLSEDVLVAPRDGRWTAAQIVEHLARAYGGTAKVLEQSIAADRIPELRKLSIKDRVSIFAVTQFFYIPGGRKAPEPTLPDENPPGLVAVQRAKENLERCGRALEQAEKKWGTGRKIFPHPVLGPLTAEEMSRFHLAHTKHHMKQLLARIGHTA